MSGWVRECDRDTEVPGTMREVNLDISALESRLALLKTLQQCDWHRGTKVFSDGQTIPNVHVCSRCGSWTANLPLYRDGVCEVRK